MKLFLQNKYLLMIATWMVVTSTLGGLATELSPWYFSLKQPPWKPPDWAFGVIWTAIFIMTAMAWTICFRNDLTASQKNKLIALFILNGFLNVFWSVLYFRWHQPVWSLIEAAFLWLSVLGMMFVMWPIQKIAAFLMLPYLVWVAIAMLLNWQTIVLNPGAY